MIQRYGREITQEMVPIVEWEGYTDGEYKDTKGVTTTGVGQTGKYAKMGYPEAFTKKKAELIKFTPNLSSLPDEVQDALLVANWRGDWSGSPKTRALFKEGRYADAAKEFLDNKEYLDEATPRGIKKRFEYVADAIKSLA